MAEEQPDFAVQLEQFLEEHDYDMPKAGDIRTGVIVSISQQGIIVDLGVKRDGLVPASDLQKLSEAERNSLKVGDETAVYISGADDADSLTVSIFRARIQEDWARAEALVSSGEIIEVEIDGYNKGGLIAPFGRLRGFIPLSQVSGFSRNLNDRERQRRMSKLRGQMLPVKVIEVDRNRRRLVFSEREGSRVVEEGRRHELLTNLRAGDVIKGRVRSIRDYGAFVDLGGVDGLVHVSEMAWYRVRHPKELLKVGDEVEVQVLEVDANEQRIRLTRKPFVSSPWDSVDERYKDGQLVEGRIVRIVSYGAFVELEPGIEGLLHSSQLARNPVADPREIVKENEVHLLRILSIDKNQERIRLSLKAVTPREQIEWMARQRPAEEEVGAAEEEEAEELEEEAAEDAAEFEEIDAEGGTFAAEVEDTAAETTAATPEQPEAETAASEQAEAAAEPEQSESETSTAGPSDEAGSPLISETPEATETPADAG